MKSLKKIFYLALPIIFTNIMQTVYQLIDTFWVGRLGKDAVAAISISFPVLFLMLSIGIGFSIAGTILVSQYNGRKDLKMVNYVSTQTLFVTTIIAITLAIAGFIFSSNFIKLMGADDKIFNSAVSYLRLSFIGSVFIYIFMVFQSLLQGIKIVIPPAIIVTFTVLLNLILDPIFIFGFKLGVNGAAVSTIITQLVASIIAIYFFTTGKYRIKINFKKFFIDFKLIAKMLKLGLPSSIEYSVRAFVMTLITAIVATFGSSSLAAYGVGIRLFTFVVIIGVGISSATATLIGHSFGEENITKASKIAISSIFISSITFAIIGIFFFVFSYQISSIFITKDGDAVKLTSEFIKILSFGFIFLGIQISLNGIFRGSGNTHIAMLLTIITMAFLRLPLSFLLSKIIFKSPIGIWLAFPFSNLIAAITGLFIFYHGKWKNKRIIYG